MEVETYLSSIFILLEISQKPTDFGRGMNCGNKMYNYLKINGKFLEKISNFCVLLDNNYQVKQFKV